MRIDVRVHLTRCAVLNQQLASEEICAAYRLREREMQS
jgi:hypothetical protein